VFDYTYYCTKLLINACMILVISFTEKGIAQLIFLLRVFPGMSDRNVAGNVW